MRSERGHTAQHERSRLFDLKAVGAQGEGHIVDDYHALGARYSTCQPSKFFEL